MKRIISTLLGLHAVMAGAHSPASGTGHPQYYELRIYTTHSTRQLQLVNDYWQNAAVPAYNRLGIQPVGVFTELKDSTCSSLYVLIPFEAPEAFAAVPAGLASDSAYREAAAGYMAVPKSDPAFDRIESSLLEAFDGMKKLALPKSTEGKKPWIFELRNYWSHSESKGVNKVEMFNSGEIDLMKEVGLSPVFFARTVVGPQMPNLVYMVSGESMAEHRKHWNEIGRAHV
jgi:hypothetical protein